MSAFLRRRWAALLLLVLTLAASVGMATDLGGPEPLPPRDETSAVGLGDSVMAGTACSCPGITAVFARTWAQRLHRRVAQVNLGISGDTTDELMQRLRTDPTTRRAVSDATYVLVTEGANDLVPLQDKWEDGGLTVSAEDKALTTLGTEMTSTLDQLRRLARPGSQIVVTGYWNVFEDGQQALAASTAQEVAWSRRLTKAANLRIERAARASGARYVDLTPVLLPGGRDPTPVLAADGDHPNAAGVRAIAAALVRATDPPAH